VNEEWLQLPNKGLLFELAAVSVFSSLWTISAALFAARPFKHEGNENAPGKLPGIGDEKRGASAPNRRKGGFPSRSLMERGWGATAPSAVIKAM